MEEDLSLTAYRIFNAVAKTGNISTAAKELYISQPAISKSISKLEHILNTTLFIRSSRGVKLTEEGKQLYEYTKNAFETIREGEELLKRNRMLGVGHVRIGVSTTLCKYLLLPFLKEFVSKFPHIRFTIQCQSTFQTLDLLEEGKLDIGLVGKPEQMKGLDFYAIGQIQDTFIADKSYLENLYIREGISLFESGPVHQPIGHKIFTNLREEDAVLIFEKANLMLLDEKNITRMFIERYFSENGIQTGQILEVSNMDLLIEFAKTGLGIACVIKEFVKDDLRTGSLIEIKLPVPIEQREVGFAYQKGLLNEGTKKFIDYYKTKQ